MNDYAVLVLDDSYEERLLMTEMTYGAARRLAAQFEEIFPDKSAQIIEW